MTKDMGNDKYQCGSGKSVCLHPFLKAKAYAHGHTKNSKSVIGKHQQGHQLCPSRPEVDLKIPM